MSDMWQKFKDMIGINENEYDEDYVEYYPEEEVTNTASYPEAYSDTQEADIHNYQSNRGSFSGKQGVKMTKSNVIGMPGLNNGVSEVVVIEPHSFEEMPQVIQALRERRSVVLNLNVMNPEEAQRAVDFVAGGTYAMDGHQERVGESIFLFTPSCVKVSTLSGILHDVEKVTETHIRKSVQNSDPWSEQSVIAQ
ncbi:MAG: cell division protein SepF [Xenococcaceae cyanobacterium]